jgi:hypothetical protein
LTGQDTDVIFVDLGLLEAHVSQLFMKLVPISNDEGVPKLELTLMVVDGDNTLDGKTGLIQDLVPGFQDWKYSGTMTQTWHQVQMTQIYSNPLNFFASSCPENPCRCLFPRLLHAFFSKVKFYSKKITFPGLPGQGRWREDKHLSYKDLLTITFTQVSH